MNSIITDKYNKIWSNPDLVSRINDGIRMNRQSDGRVRITNFAGKPLEGVSVRVEQHNSSFNFGSNIFKLGDFPNATLNEKYENAFGNIFNRATVPFYWRSLEPEQGRPRFSKHSVPIARRPAPDRVVQFCKEKGLRMHGHTLVWNFRKWSTPDWLPTDPDQAAPLWEKRIKEIAERYGDDIPSWDVVNEIAVHYEKRQDGMPMQPNYGSTSFAWAEKYFPSNTRLDINETTNAWDKTRLEYTQLIKGILQEKRRLGAIGLQFHQFHDQDTIQMLAGEKYLPSDLLEVLDTYGKFNLPLHISEITLTAPENSEAGLAAQALVAKNLYRMWFSHAAVEGITWWNFPDGGACSGEDKVYSGLLFEDMSPKPAYHALHDLIHNEWRTREEGLTDADGYFSFRGFHGTYRIFTSSHFADSGMQSSMTLEPGKSTDQLIMLQE
jgi:GH35 family endo-1,4-beta-xylanase